MTDSSLASFFVPGIPKPAGSKVSGVATKKDASGRRVPILRDNGMPKTFTKDSSGDAGKAWRQDVREAAGTAMGGRAPFQGALFLWVEFYMPRPAGHYGSGRNAGVLKDSSPRWPTTRPDATKLLRGTEDAMLGVVYSDDSQIVRTLVTKSYAHQGRVGALIAVAYADVPAQVALEL